MANERNESKTRVSGSLTEYSLPELLKDGDDEEKKQQQKRGVHRKHPLQHDARGDCRNL